MESKVIDERRKNYYDEDDLIDNDSDYKFSTDNLSQELKDVINNRGSFSTNCSTDLSNSTEAKIDWEPPKSHGLRNSDAIIPSYYFNKSLMHLNSNNLIDLKYLTIVRDDIRNYRKLTQHQVDYICKLDNENKDELLKLLIYVNAGLIDSQRL